MKTLVEEMNEQLRGKVDNSYPSHLDKIIAEQARYYNLSVDEFAKMSDELAKLQEECEFDN